MGEQVLDKLGKDPKSPPALPESFWVDHDET